MAFDNEHPNRKDHRKPFRKAKAIDRTCRNHGDCPYCQGNRFHKDDVKKLDMTEQEDDMNNMNESFNESEDSISTG